MTETPTYTYRDRRGTLYFRRRGMPQVRMICQDPQAPSFLHEYSSLLESANHKPTDRIAPTSEIPDQHYRNMEKSARARAKKQGVPFKLPPGWCKQAAAAQSHRCAVSGVAFSIDRSKRSPNMPSIDRREPSKGYTPENCRMVTYMANCAMNIYGEIELLAMCRAVVRMADE